MGKLSSLGKLQFGDDDFDLKLWNPSFTGL
jgi:hypothetical protein